MPEQGLRHSIAQALRYAARWIRRGRDVGAYRSHASAWARWAGAARSRSAASRSALSRERPRGRRQRTRIRRATSRRRRLRSVPWWRPRSCTACRGHRAPRATAARSRARSVAIHTHGTGPSPAWSARILVAYAARVRASRRCARAVRSAVPSRPRTSPQHRGAPHRRLAHGMRCVNVPRKSRLPSDTPA